VGPKGTLTTTKCSDVSQILFFVNFVPFVERPAFGMQVPLVQLGCTRLAAMFFAFTYVCCTPLLVGYISAKYVFRTSISFVDSLRNAVMHFYRTACRIGQFEKY
jgi:hypothetical protein